MHLMGVYHRMQPFCLSRTYVFAAFGGRWPGVAFLILALSVRWPCCQYRPPQSGDLAIVHGVVRCYCRYTEGPVTIRDDHLLRLTSLSKPIFKDSYRANLTNAAPV